MTVPKALNLEGLVAPQRAAGRAVGPAGRLFWIFRISGRIEAVQKPDRPAHLSAKSLGARAVIERQNDFSPPGRELISNMCIKRQRHSTVFSVIDRD